MDIPNTAAETPRTAPTTPHRAMSFGRMLVLAQRRFRAQQPREHTTPAPA